MSQAVLLKGVEELLNGVRAGARHPGLALDKFSPPGKQEEQKPTLDRVCDATGAPVLLRELGARRDAVLGHSGAMTWEATTSGPLTLHLSRANALENAGIALHPLYGFAYLPGSGLKGAARAYAETIWLAGQPETEKKAAHEQIIAVFGCAPGSDKNKDWLPACRQEAQDSSAGAVVFHDAWPKTWPTLFVDIAAIHHPKYYQAPEGNVPPPGDWETPTLISFLAIQPGTTFHFALAPRAKTVDAKLIDLAKAWLNGALATLGIGAKTSAGYGLFMTDAAAPVATPNRAEASFELKLVTPAFLAGAAQKQEDCDLRGATLRGQLRWWWRTLHAAHLEPATLRRLEATVWGASSEGSAVQIRLTASAGPLAERFNYNAEKNGQFLGNNKIDLLSKSVPDIEKRKTTQGLYYAAYGVGQEAKGGRFFRQPGSTWHLCIGARKSAYRMAVDANVKRPIPPGDILRQAEAALFLLTRYGGVGAKGRKGFGSFEDIAIDEFVSIEDCKRAASDFRRLCGLPTAASALREDAPSQELMSEPIVVQTKWTNAWFALNRVGEAMQAYAKTGKHQIWKSALGLPRKGDRGPISVKAAIGTNGTITRHAAPIHFHIAKSGEALVLRLVTFVSPHLPDRKTSETKLTALRDHVLQLIGKQANQGGTAAMFPKKTQMAVLAPDGGQPRVGSRIQAKLLPRTGTKGWRARDLASGAEGSIMNMHMVPPDKNHGDVVELEVHRVKEFKWPVPPPPARPTAPARGGPRGRR